MAEAVFSIDIDAPMQRVWDTITRRGVRCDAMFGTYWRGDLAPGAFVKHTNKSGSRTFVAYEVLEVDPPRRLVHTFWFTLETDEPTLVEWKLEPMGAGTRVTVTHSRFDGETKTFKAVSQGWPRILGLYKTIIESGGAPFMTRVQNAMMMMFAFMMPAPSRSENVTLRKMKM